MAPNPTIAAPVVAPEVMDLVEVARFLGVTTRTIRRWRRGARPLPALKVTRFSILFEKAAVLDWLRSHRETPTRSTPRRVRRPVAARA